MARRSALPAEEQSGSHPDPVGEPGAPAADVADHDLDDVLAAPDDPAATGDAIPETIPRPVRVLVWQARIGLGVGFLGLCLALVFFLQAADLRTDAARRAAVLDAGEVMALRVTTFAGESIDEWVEDTQSLATGAYADEVAQLFDPVIRQGLADAGVESVGEILNSFVQEVEGDTATVFVVLRQTYTSELQPQAVSDELRMEVELSEVDGRWLASEVAVLGPSTITPVGPDGDAVDPAASADPGGG